MNAEKANKIVEKVNNKSKRLQEKTITRCRDKYLRGCVKLAMRYVKIALKLRLRETDIGEDNFDWWFNYVPQIGSDDMKYLLEELDKRGFKAKPEHCTCDSGIFMRVLISW